MKYLLTLCSMIISAQLMGQSIITSMSVSPPNPTVNDAVTLYAVCQFPSGDCSPDYLGHNVTGFTVEATGHHCLGPLAFICSYTDTFEVGLLPAGDYTFDFTLTTGFGTPGCSPGIVPDDNDQLQFTVSSHVGIDEHSLQDNFVFPNPTNGSLFFKTPLKKAVVLTNIHGQKLLEIQVGASQADIEEFPSGIYFIASENQRLKIVKN